MSLANALRRGSRTQSPEPALPTGTVTFLLTDVEASTASWDADADGTDAGLRELDEHLDVCAGGHGGRLLKSRGEGDSAFAVFVRSSEAVQAACDLQRSLATSSLRVRAAIHTGETRLRNGDYFGVAPNRTARLRALAHGGQIVVSRVSADLAEAALPDEISLIDLGSYRVRDWPRTERLFGVKSPGIRSDFPPLRILGDAQRAVMTIAAVDLKGTSTTVRSLSDPELIEMHRGLAGTIEDVFRSNGGAILKMMGDGCVASFEDPISALEFCRSLHRRSAATVRLGLQTGIVEFVGEDVVGRAIYDAFGASQTADGEEIVITRTVSDLLAGQGLTAVPKPNDDGLELFSLRLS